MKIFFAVLALLLMGSMAWAQTTETKGINVNPFFVGPAQFVETANGLKLLPNAGLSVAIEYQDVQTVTLDGVTAKHLLWAGGLVFEENFGQAANAQTVNNAILGLGGTWQGIQGVIGFQIMGPSLGGDGSSGLVFGCSQSLDSIL